jgi:hypothetical protein
VGVSAHEAAEYELRFRESGAKSLSGLLPSKYRSLCRATAYQAIVDRVPNSSLRPHLALALAQLEKGRRTMDEIDTAVDRVRRQPRNRRALQGLKRMLVTSRSDADEDLLRAIHGVLPVVNVLESYWEAIETAAVSLPRCRDHAVFAPSEEDALSVIRKQ